MTFENGPSPNNYKKERKTDGIQLREDRFMNLNTWNVIEKS